MIAENVLGDDWGEYCHWDVEDNGVAGKMELELEFVACLLGSVYSLKKPKHQSDFQMVDTCDLAAMIHCKVMGLLEL